MGKCSRASLSDQDGDKKLTLSEFISLPVGTVENQQAQDVDDDWVRERKKEFEDVIDADKNGIVTMEELEVRRRIHSVTNVAYVQIRLDGWMGRNDYR